MSHAGPGERRDLIASKPDESGNPCSKSTSVPDFGEAYVVPSVGMRRLFTSGVFRCGCTTQLHPNA
jgi:hypothetical protein